MRYTLTAQDNDDPGDMYSRITFSSQLKFEAETLDSVLEYVEQFLAGCGYQLSGGHLELVSDEADGEPAA